MCLPASYLISFFLQELNEKAQAITHKTGIPVSPFDLSQPGAALGAGVSPVDASQQLIKQEGEPHNSSESDSSSGSDSSDSESEDSDSSDSSETDSEADANPHRSVDTAPKGPAEQEKQDGEPKGKPAGQSSLPLPLG